MATLAMTSTGTFTSARGLLHDTGKARLRARPYRPTTQCYQRTCSTLILLHLGVSANIVFLCTSAFAQSSSFSTATLSDSLLNNHASVPQNLPFDVLTEASLQGASHSFLRKPVQTFDSSDIDKNSRKGASRFTHRKRLQSLEQTTEESTVTPRKRAATRRINRRRPPPATICWDGPAEANRGRPWFPDNSELRQLSHVGVSARENIIISGEGCVECRVGELCRFNLIFASDMYFDWAMPFPEIMVLLTGPALYVADVQGGLHTLYTFLVSYTAWDEGEYNMSIVTDCSGTTGTPQSLATLPLHVYPSTSSIAAWTTPGSSNIVEAPSGGIVGTSPCAEGMPGRWLMVEDEDQNVWPVYSAFPCAGIKRREVEEANGKKGKWKGQLLPVNSFVSELAAKKVVEISMIGDEHMRNMFFQIQSFLSGKVFGGIHEDIVWDYMDAASGFSLRMNFYWLDGIYEDGHFGCHFRGTISGRTTTFPAFSQTSDIVIIGDGLWTFKNCKHGEQAYAYYVPQLLDWMTKEAANTKESTRLIWRSAPPYPAAAVPDCEHMRNSALAWANSLARDLTEAAGVEYLDLWPVEAVGYDEACSTQNDDQGLGDWENDVTYTCLYYNYTRVYGSFGYAATRTFMHLLAQVD
eukprot:TRINITY_DN11034_c0_g1_i1.p1 TRINITY_DN11034_c0_g1~~TRINITY_DN11034_c0_g1_i1.p1  ORF type:complete len:637 (+),score=52.25 TRINITY_DN11034_c0_g1_i1:662-2572(+)